MGIHTDTQYISDKIFPLLLRKACKKNYRKVFLANGKNWMEICIKF